MTAACLNLTDLAAYKESCLAIAQERLGSFSSIADIVEKQDELNAYQNLGRLSEPKDIQILAEDSIKPDDMESAKRAALDGRIFFEHTAAGEATRLKLGTKFLIDVSRDLTVEIMAEGISDELEKSVSPDEVRTNLSVEPAELIPLDLGSRHMLQLAFDLSRLAGEYGRDARNVLACQKNLLIMNEKTAQTIIDQAVEYNFYGFARENFLFMIQPAFHGINLVDGRFFFDENSPKRMHNHGQLVMQESMDNMIFRLNETGGREYLPSDEFGMILQGSLDKISYNIEDLGYLTASMDWPSQALALILGNEGFRMVMEIVANNPDRPQKGGLAAWDEVLNRNVMIESFQLKGIPNEDIKYLNKNFNHYTRPYDMWNALRERGLPMPISVKEGLLYFQPVQGDINFLVNTAFVQREKVKPIKAWKSAVNTPATVNAMREQDNQPGFRGFTSDITGRKF